MAVAVQVVSDSRAAQQDIAKLRSSVEGISQATKNATDTFKSLALSLGALATSTFGAVGLVRLSDTLTTVNSKLLVVLETQNAVNAAFKASTDIALSTRTSLTDVASLYSRIAMSSKSLGASQNQIAKVTSSISKAISASGSTAQESSAAVMQLGQALASGRLQGDELRSILENAPLLAQQIAEGLGKTVSEMRDLGTAGKLTSRDVFGAILKQTDQINKMSGNIGITFSSAFTNVGNALSIMYAGFTKYLDEESKFSSGKTIAARINDAALSVAKLGMDFRQLTIDIKAGIWSVVLDAEQGFQRVSKQVQGIYSGVAKDVSKSASTVGDTIAAQLSNVSIKGLSFKLDTTKINIGQFFPNLESIRRTVIDWVTTIERAFFWLYDQVIGHSWIPDLVDGVIFWMRKLMGDPLGTALSFTKRVGDAFESLTARVMKGDFAAVIAAQLAEAKAAIDRTKFARNIRQTLGMQEVQPGSYADRSSRTGQSSYTTDTYVGRGPLRDQKNRTPLHDITNAFKSENQSPFLATVFTAVGAGLLMAVSSGSVIKGIAVAFAAGIGTAVLGSYNNLLPVGIFIGGGIIAALTGGSAAKAIAAVVTTAFGLVSAKVISDKELSLTTGSIVNAFLNGVKGAINMLFGSGLFGEKGFLGTLSLLAKLALMFAKGREIIGNAALAVAKSPTSIVDNLSDRVLLRSANKELLKNTAAAAMVTTKSQAATAQAQAAMAMAKQKLNSATNANSFNTAAAQMARAQKLVSASQALAAAAPADIARLSAEREKLAQNQKTLADRIDATSKRFREGVMAGGAGIGAIFGTMAGFEIGNKIAEQMTSYSGWAKAGVQMAGAFIGQGIGAAIGTVAGAGILQVLSALPAILAALGIGALIWAGMNWESVYANLKDVWKEVEPVFAKAWVQLTAVLDGFIGKLIVSLKSLVPNLSNRVGNVVSNTEVGKDGQINPFSLVSNIAKEVVGLRSDLGTGTIGNKSIVTGASFASDPFIAGQVAAAQASVSDADRKTNLAAWNKISSFFDQPISKILESITSTIFGVKDAGAAESAKVVGAIEATNKATRADIVVPPSEDTLARLVAAIKRTEGTSEGVTSFKGASGVMQIIPDTFNSVVAQHKLVGKSFDSASDRIEVATRHIADLWAKYQDPAKVFAVYNGGPKAVAANGDLVSRHTMKDGKSIDDSSSYAKRALKVFEGAGGESTGTKVGKAIAGKLNLASNEFAKFKDNPADYIEATLVAMGLKSPMLEGPPAPTQEEKLRPKLLSAKLEGLYSAEKSLEEINTAIGSINAKALDLAQYKAIPKDELEVIVRNFDNIAKFNDALLGNLSDFTRRGTEEKLKELATQNKKLLAEATKKLAPDQALELVASADASKAGTDYATKVRDDFSSALGAGLSGDSKPLKDFAKNFADTFTKSILNSFAKGITDTFFKTSGLEELLGGLIKGSMFSGEKAGTTGGTGVSKLIAGGINKLSSLPTAFKYGTNAGSTQTDILKSQDAAFSEPILDIISSSGELTVDAIGSASQDNASTIVSGLGGVFTKSFQDMGMTLNSAFLGIQGAMGFGAFSGGGGGGGFDAFGTILKVAGLAMSAYGGAGVTDAAGATVGSNLGAGVGQNLTFDSINMSSASFNVGSADVGVSGNMFSSASSNTIDMGGGSGLRFATGGLIRGPGTGTSDSIPIMASNREFMVNAKQTAKFRPLLEAINSGSISKFATGGFISNDIGSNVVVQAATKRNQEMGLVPGGNKNTSVFNINVTGDVSRQTRKEIQQMMPTIAVGVNNHNHENGMKR
jgi:tape measure domain-containing protein